MNRIATFWVVTWLIVVVACSSGPGASCPDEGCADSTAGDGVEPDSSLDAPGFDAPRDSLSSDAMADGQCCDPETGECGACDDECWSCAGGWECRSGLFCLTIPGYAGICTPLCSTVAECPDSEKYTCQFWSDFGVCVPNVNKCPGCYAPTPFPLGDTCVECRDGRDCGGGGACCHPEYHFCMVMSCGTGTIFNPELCECRQCFTGDDCLRFEDATGVCLADGTCEGVVPCDGMCTSDFPVCAVVNGVEQCVQCGSDEDCSLIDPECTCVGDPLYSCMAPDGSLCVHSCGGCFATCEESTDCQPAQDEAAQDCVKIADGAIGYCVDPSGHCDGTASCCAPGQDCVDLVLVLQEIYPTVLRIIPTPDQTLTYCECDTVDDCLTGDPCTDLSILCTSGDFATEGVYELICPGGQLHEAFPDKLCVQPAMLLEYFGVVPSM